MAVPGLRPELPLRAKVRIGERTERGAPRSLDHFVCPDDPGFAGLAGDRPKTLAIRFPYAEPEACWSSGLELWLRGRDKPILGCYTKGDGTAHRLGKDRDPAGAILLEPRVLADRSVERKRQPMSCPAQACPYHVEEKCKPVGRLSFQLVGGPVDSVYRFETKSLSSIEIFEGVMQQFWDPRRFEFELYVERRKKQGKEYSIVGLRLSGRASSSPFGGQGASTDPHRAECAALLRQLGQYPPNQAVTDWIKDKGYEGAARQLRARVEAQTEAPDA